MTDLTAAVTARFLAVNGEHPMTPEDDAYVNEWFVPLERVAAAAGREPDELRRLILDRRLPLPSYLRSDGAQMVPADFLELLDEAGGAEAFPAWFASHWEDAAEAAAEWDGYLAGHYVCLRHVTPATIRRKGELVQAIEERLAAPQPASPAWLDGLHALVDELDELEPPFAPYDRLRFGGPVSRDRLIDAVRERYPRTIAAWRTTKTSPTASASSWPTNAA